MGLELVNNPGGSMQLGQDGANKQTSLMGKSNNTLLTQILIFSLSNKSALQDILKELNEEVPPHE